MSGHILNSGLNDAFTPTTKYKEVAMSPIQTFLQLRRLVEAGTVTDHFIAYLAEKRRALARITSASALNVLRNHDMCMLCPANRGADPRARWMGVPLAGRTVSAAILADAQASARTVC